MPQKVMRVVGSLNPSKPEAVKETTHSRIDIEMVRHGLATLLADYADWDGDAWISGVVTVNSRSDVEGGGRPAAKDFITRLYNFVTAPGIAELGLEGELTVAVDGVKEPVVFKLTVKNNNIFQQEATLIYGEAVPFMEKA